MPPCCLPDPADVDAVAPGRFADLDGVRLWYRDTGGPGTPVILLHPNTGTSQSWCGQLPALSAAGFRTVAFDRSGWGLSTPVGVQRGSVSQDLDSLVEHLGIGWFHLVGAAAGGFSAIDYAAWRPEKVASLVAVATTGWFREKEIDEFSAAIDIGRLRDPDLVVCWEVSAGYRGTCVDGTRRWVEISREARQPGVEAQPLRTPNTFAKLDRITAPVLALAGGADLAAPPALMRRWAARIQNCEFAVIAEAGHAVQWENPDAFNERVLRFLLTHDRKPDR
ncbi:alpha/beta hydrolase [Streptomyces sp. NBC_00988]|uniref:alpha/beta fold hydrolase n=1 Tax=Streptomyces sp. NBC_00988 TaxID=2903704 RepID=UPI00386728B1|nr:alpha/beta hydrolase [Streptomyces sp. NBC_00988]